jgi:ribulose-5-phosphate 4-epimerase/fuculose-1-phosphate aldolase
MTYEDGVIRPDAINIQELINRYINDFLISGKLIDENGLAVGSGGNLSIRVPGGMLITSTGSLLNNLNLDEIVFVTFADRDSVYFIGSKKPSSEAINHWTIYQEMPNVKAISHVNVGPKDSKNIITTAEEIPYGTIELGYDVVVLLKRVDVVMLKNHGVIAIGQNLIEATNLLVESADKNKPYIFGPLNPINS